MTERDKDPDVNFTPPSNWRSTGIEAPKLTGGYVQPPGGGGDHDRRVLLASTIAALYSAVGSAQNAEPAKDDQTNAVHQLVVANAALVASEADAFLTIISAGLDGPSQVHIRSISELTGRVILCRERPDLALKLYQTAGPNWKKLASKLGVPNAPELEKAEQDMRVLEMTAELKEARADVVKRFHLFDDFYASMFSKRSHGDIYALVEVSNGLLTRDGNVSKAINKVLPQPKATNILIDRATAITIAALVHVAEEFGMEGEPQIKEIFKKYEQMQERDKKSGALRIFERPVGQA